MNEVIQTIIKKGITDYILLDIIILAIMVFLGTVLYLRVTKVDFNPDHFRNKKKILELKEYLELSKNYENDFNNDFTENRLKELFFELHTGISTHYQSINNYLTLHNQLGKEFTWKLIKNAKPYLVLDGNSLKIEISKIDLISYKLTKSAIVFIPFVFAALLILLLFVFDQINLQNKLYLLYSIFLSAALLLFLVFSQEGVKSALRIQKSLE
jgi:hypothetical protein